MMVTTKDILFIVLPLALAVIGIAYFQKSTPIPTWDRYWISPRVLTKEELARANGKNGANCYLCILGEIYDVTGSEHYQEHSGYYVFIGQDATLAFVSGKFDETATDDVSSLDSSQIKGVEDWIKFYRTHEKYRFVGVLEGRYYTGKGKRTKAWNNARDKMELAETARLKEEQDLKKTPSCNSKWTQNEGSTIWCENSMVSYPLNSPLVPRITELNDGPRCVCIELDLAKQNIDLYRAYVDCDPSNQKCHIKPLQ